MTVKALKKNNMKKRSGFKMKGSPMQRNFGIGSPMRNEPKTTEPTRPVGEDETGTKDNPHSMFGRTNDENTKIVNEAGNWVSLTRGTGGSNTLARYNAHQ